MFRTLALLTVALTLAIPAFADTASNPAPENANSLPHKQKSKINAEPVGFSEGRSESNGQGSGKSAQAGTTNLGQVKLNPTAKKSMLKNPTVKNPCKGPNPPHDCKQVNPPHPAG